MKPLIRPRIAAAIVGSLVLGLWLLLAGVSTARERHASGCREVPGGGLTFANIGANGARLMAVGSDGLIAESTGRSRWVVRPAPVGHALRGVVWTGSRWVVLGDAGTILSSSDGRHWQAAHGIPDVGLRAVAARAGLVLVAGSGGTLLESPDGLSWSAQASGTSENLWGAARLDSELLVSGAEATVIASGNGISWSSVPTRPYPTGNPAAPRPFLWQLGGMRKRLVAVGDFGSVLEGSAAGLTAVRSPTEDVLRGIAFGRGIAVAVGSSGTILRSSAPGQWSVVRSPTTVDLRGVVYTGSRFVAVGDESTIVSSRDGRRWRIEATAMPCALLAVTRGAAGYIAVGGAGRIISSADGRAWRRSPSPTRQDLYALAEGPAGFVAVGAHGAVVESHDGRRWAPRHLATHLNLHAVTWTGRDYLVGGDRGRLFASSRGVRWERVSFPGFHSIRDFATEAGVTVAAGAGTIARRATSGAWTLEPLGFGRFQTSVAAGAGRFVIVGHNGEALVSTDGGSTWSSGTTGVEINLDRVVYAGGRFIATGEGEALTSSDGVAWSPLALPTARSVRAIAVDGRTLVAVGDGDVILRSADGGHRWLPLGARFRG